MKPFEQDKVNRLLEMLEIKSDQHLAHCTGSSHMLTKYVYQFCLNHAVDYHLFTTKDVFYDKSMTKYTNQSHIQIKKLDLADPKRFTPGTTFDYILITLDLTEEVKKAFLTKCSPLIRHHGTLIIISPKTVFTEGQTWNNILQEQHYISINNIKDIFAYYDVIIAKDREVREKQKEATFLINQRKESI